MILYGKRVNFTKVTQAEIPRDRTANRIRGNSSSVVAYCLLTNPPAQSEFLAEALGKNPLGCATAYL
jgi:hypothetical protein